MLSLLLNSPIRDGAPAALANRDNDRIEERGGWRHAHSILIDATLRNEEPTKIERPRMWGLPLTITAYRE
jgi:hypothetical protein